MLFFFFFLTGMNDGNELQLFFVHRPTQMSIEDSMEKITCMKNVGHFFAIIFEGINKDNIVTIEVILMRFLCMQLNDCGSCSLSLPLLVSLVKAH